MAVQIRGSLGLLGAFSSSRTATYFGQHRFANTSISTAWRLASTALPWTAAAVSIPLRLPNLLGEIWESILRAVPKKKTSHRKKRQRFLAGKALQDVTALNKCPACGNVKRAHLLCPFCVKEIQDMWKGKSPKHAAEAETAAEAKEGKQDA